MEEHEIRAIAEQNDAFRKAFGKHPEIKGDVYTTRTISELPDKKMFSLFDQIREFEDFADDCPLHDMGMITFDGKRCMFKIDLYDTKLEYGSEDPANLSVTRRVLTILYASEY